MKRAQPIKVLSISYELLSQSMTVFVSFKYIHSLRDGSLLQGCRVFDNRTINQIEQFTLWELRKIQLPEEITLHPSLCKTLQNSPSLGTSSGREVTCYIDTLKTQNISILVTIIYKNHPAFRHNVLHIKKLT